VGAQTTKSKLKSWIGSTITESKLKSTVESQIAEREREGGERERKRAPAELDSARCSTARFVPAAEPDPISSRRPWTWRADQQRHRLVSSSQQRRHPPQAAAPPAPPRPCVRWKGARCRYSRKGRGGSGAAVRLACAASSPAADGPASYSMAVRSYARCCRRCGLLCTRFSCALSRRRQRGDGGRRGGKRGREAAGGRKE
jgi:hypothetical protein